LDEEFRMKTSAYIKPKNYQHKAHTIKELQEGFFENTGTDTMHVDEPMNFGSSDWTFYIVNINNAILNH